jgi:hypothetical protein
VTTPEDLLRLDPPPPDLPDQLAAALRRQPFHRMFLRRCMARIGGGDRARGLAWAISVQEASDLPIHAILDEVAAAEGEGAPARRFGDRLAATAAPVLARIARGWEEILSGRLPDPADGEALAADRDYAIVPYFRFLTPPPRMLHLRSRARADRAAVVEAGIALEAQRAFLDRFLAPAEGWQGAMAAARFPSPEARERVAAAEGGCGWIDRTLADGRLVVADPLDGREIAACDGIVAYGRGLYLFRGVEPFFLLTGDYWNAPQGFYLPRRNLILSFGGERRLVLQPDRLSNILRAYLVRRAVPRAAERTEPGFTLFLPPTDNFAHQLWNFQTGIERAVRLGGLGRVAAVRFTGTEFFGPLAEIFPELGTIPVERPKRDHVVDPAPHDPTRLPLPSAGFFIPRSLTDRILGVMRRRPRGRPDAVEPADLPRGPDAPVVWLGLRTRGRAWVGQEEGFAAIMRHVAARAPGAVFLLDGFSYPVGIDECTAGWADAIALLRQVAERIRAASPDPARVVNMVGNTLRESVLWAAETDAYLTPYGSTQHKVGWFTDAPGLVYAPPAIEPRQVNRSAGWTAAEISTVPTLVYGRPVAGHDDGVGPAREARASTVNLELDAADLATRLWALLEARMAAKAARG